MAGTIVESFVGKWIEYSITDFDKYCAKLGLSPALIAAAMRAKVDETWSIDGDKITYGMHSSVASNTLTFKLNEQFDQVSPAGRHLQSTYTIEDKKLVKRQTAAPWNSTKYVELGKDGQLIETMVCHSPEPVTAVRLMKKV